MIPIIFINCHESPFIDDIINLSKLYETRTRNTLRHFIGKRVLLAETGNGRPVVRCSAVIRSVEAVRSRAAWETVRPACCILRGSRYDWQPETTVKYLYELSGVVACHTFHPAEDVRHGRVWMEYNGKVVD